MKNTRLIARLDIKAPFLVKGIQLEGLRKLGDPNDFALKYYHAGIDEIFYIDIVASLYDRNSLTDIISKTTNEIFVPITVGGGIRTVKDMTNFLLAGADKVSINSSAIASPELITKGAEKFGKQCIVVAIDSKKNNEGFWDVYTHGGRKNTGIDSIKWAQKVESLGAGEILLTSMDRDGTKKGFDLELTKKISEIVSIPVIASGGVGKLDHLVDGILIGGASAVLAASIFHFGEFTITEVKKHLFSKGIQVRLDY